MSKHTISRTLAIILYECKSYSTTWGFGKEFLPLLGSWGNEDPGH